MNKILRNLLFDDVDGTIKDSDIGNHLKWQNLTTTKIDI